MAGRGSLAGLLAYGNANDIVVEMADEVLPVVAHTPVLAGVNATDPFMVRSCFLRRLKDMDFSGVQNFPIVGLIDGSFRANLEEAGMGYAAEVVPRLLRGEQHGAAARRAGADRADAPLCRAA